MKEKFSRWHVLFMLYLKRDFKKILVWMLGLGVFSAGFVPAFEEIAKGQGLLGMYETMQNPAMTAMVGPTPIETATGYSIGAMYSHEMLLFCSLFAMVIAALHMISHTRKEEDLGLTELVRSFQIGRQANSLAVLIEILFIHIILGLLISGIMLSFGVESISVEGSFLFGATIAMAGIMGSGIALVMAQIMPVSSGATGSTLGIIGLLYIIRAGTDISSADLSLFNPLGWTYLTYPFTENNWIPLIFAVIFSVITVAIAFVLEGSRDMGAGYLPERQGREYAKRSLLSVRGLFFKINKGTIIAWLLTFSVMGLAYGSIYGDMQAFLESNDLMKQMFSYSDFSIEESFTAIIMMVMICLVAILPITISNKLFTEERQSHLSQLYATKTSRAMLFWTTIGLAIFVSLIGIVLAAGSLGGAAIAAMGEGATMNLLDFMIAGFNFIPVILFFIGLAALSLGFAPRLGKTVYIYLAYSFFLSYFSGILNVPEWFSKTAIQSWMPHLPMEDFNILTFVIITLISMILMVVGYLGYRRRDLLEGA